jgi:hypothetical protein
LESVGLPFATSRDVSDGTLAITVPTATIVSAALATVPAICAKEQTLVLLNAPTLFCIHSLDCDIIQIPFYVRSLSRFFLE